MLFHLKKMIIPLYHQFILLAYDTFQADQLTNIFYVSPDFEPLFDLVLPNWCLYELIFAYFFPINWFHVHCFSFRLFRVWRLKSKKVKNKINGTILICKMSWFLFQHNGNQPLIPLTIQQEEKLSGKQVRGKFYWQDIICSDKIPNGWVLRLLCEHLKG